MESIYRSPMRVYLLLAILSVIGVVSALRLPISLFPNSAKPEVTLCIGLDLAPETFLRHYGRSIEEQLRAVERGPLKVENLSAQYRPSEACYEVEFKWGGDPQEAVREIQAVANNISARLPESSRDRVNVWTNRENGGFLALSFYSDKRSLTEVYDIIEPVLAPKLSRVKDASEAFVYNPQKRQVVAELRPEALASLQLFPTDVAEAILRVFDSYNGGSLTVGTDTLRIELPRAVVSFDELKRIQIPVSQGRTVSLSDVAHLDLTVPLDSARVYKTSGAPSVLLMASPRPGGNVKAMAEEVLRIVNETMPNLPPDIQYKNLVDPSEFIRSAVNNVAKEVLIAAGLAVLILFLFIGNLRNVVTAAIEIPLSIVLAFIMMYLSGMNLNIISLGGLALSAGMNVDASVVVMENIFRHFDLAREKFGERALSFDERVTIIAQAVKEVQFSVIASTIASLVVFIPLAFTSDLSYAILGDLAKAVVFSHGFSAVVALILVPTIRLHLMKDGGAHDSPSALERFLKGLENAYGRTLGFFLSRRWLKTGVYLGLIALFAGLMFFVVPHLPREIIGKPDTDWMVLDINASGNTLNRQMEAQTEQVESELMQTFGKDIAYTFTQINQANNGTILFRLHDKRQMEDVWKRVEEHFTNTPLTSYFVDAWNPAELPLPNPPDFKISVWGSDSDAMAETTRDISVELRERKIFSRVKVEPNASVEENLRIRPYTEQWPLLAAQGLRVRLQDFADLTRIATSGRRIGRIDLKDGQRATSDEMDVTLRFPSSYVSTPEELGALPLGVNGKIIPLKALASVRREEVRPSMLRENGRQVFVLMARGQKGEEKKTKELVKQAEALVESWPRAIEERRSQQRNLTEPSKATESDRSIASANGDTSDQGGADKDPGASSSGATTAAASSDSVSAAAGPDAKKSRPTVTVDDPKKELTEALEQLVWAVSLSVGLIFLTMVFQFGSLMNSLLVLVSVPLGFIGVVISLYVFKSTLSLNSMLGVILLNGLAVANSIILVDFLQRKVREGLAPRLAAVEVARARLRPILMTSLTTGLGMLPIALGAGEGGKILQPLGIAVAGGLGFSMITTLFIVPALQVSWLEWSAARKAKRAGVAHA